MGSWQGSPTTSRPPGPAGPDVAPPRPTTRPERPADALNQPRALVPRPHTCEAATAAPAGSGEPRPATTPDGGHTSCSSTHIRDRPAHRYAHCPPRTDTVLPHSTAVPGLPPAPWTAPHRHVPPDCLWSRPMHETTHPTHLMHHGCDRGNPPGLWPRQGSVSGVNPQEKIGIPDMAWCVVRKKMIFFVRECPA